ncbi:helix-turn-helix domain-containing protein [Actinokineospora auranticolor]|uniref:PucR-like helix-turn-helix protein n=1 Tax=Actinokineospora auranticolor TaxID=155976 RepID=A0A2S6GCA1_9PSEU|nr:PucR family transcriptional regulator [Actinokineospora auranticolor]PPK62068.1 PucR-like helix-turn-helix protein [Actinokineospora auranticolor]
MDDLYTRLGNRVPVNARLVVDICVGELPEYAATVTGDRDRAAMLDFAVFIRRRTIELATADERLGPDDLAVVGEIGRERGEKGMPNAILPRVLALHAAATFREIQEASGPRDLTDTLHLLSWLGEQATAAQNAYSLGFLNGQQRHLPVGGRVRRYVEMAVAGDPAAPGYGEQIGVPATVRARVVVARPTGAGPRADEVLDGAWRRHRVPATWLPQGELVALLPEEQDAEPLVDDLTAALGPVALGTATGPAGALPETFALARRISRVARADLAPGHLHTLADLLLEVAAAELPELDRWLALIAGKLGTGPDLLDTLDVYYQADLNRAEAAKALHIHPRTLDYRLRRIRDLTGLDPQSTHGIRVLSTVITRARR